MIKCCCIKVFNCFSSRRTISELQLAYALGYIKTIPHFNSINNYMNNPEITQYFEQLYKILAFPLVEVESIFAIDSTGFSLPHKVKWLEIRLKGKWRYSKDYKKLHIITGVNTNIVTAVKITEGYKHDIKEFEPLVRETAKKFRIKEICADTGYLSRKNCDIAHEIGAIPFILPKKDTRIKSRGSYNWLRMVRLWHDNLELFKQHYHKRSNVESTFSMIKRKFLSFVRSKTDIAQTNELLCKVICHNASVLVNSIFELGIELNFEDYYK
ncbi:MAG: transposase [Candidatus Aenigmarchaeota archaeon]|nr:transposase [Candidatus Aenigmarchaeota archaeon]MDW8160357.1 transposase [Candidatus Aenigmarchaeota archaeon]